MGSHFKRSEVVPGTTRTALYGPVPANRIAIVFSGTFANTDSANKAEHKFTLEIRNVSNSYVTRLQDIPVPYGGASKCPKTVLQAGEYIYVKADAANVMQAVVDVIERDV